MEDEQVFYYDGDGLFDGVSDEVAQSVQVTLEALDADQFDQLMTLGTSVLLVGLFVFAVLLVFLGSFLASLFFRDWRV